MLRVQQFIRERQFVQNVSPNTVAWHTHSLKWLPNENPTADELTAMIVRMREKGLKATGCNSAIRSINAFLHWAHGDRNVPCGAACSHVRLRQMKEPRHAPETFSSEDVTRLLAWKPRKNDMVTQHRLGVLVAFLFDSLCRISEALNVHWDDIDFDNSLVTLRGKGDRGRIIPISLECRRRLFLWRQRAPQSPLVFPTMVGTHLGRRNALRDFKILCRKVGVVPPARCLHATRHTGAVHYVRSGGSVFHLQLMLGHSTLEMSRRYARLNTSDLSAVHQRLSLLQ